MADDGAARKAGPLQPWLPLPEAQDLCRAGREPLFDALRAGDVGARVINPDGTRPRIKPVFWARAMIDWENSRIGKAMPGYGSKPVEVSRQDLLKHFGVAKAPKKAGGRPWKWNWEAFWCELAGIVHEEGLPEVQARLVERMQQWFVDKYDEHPHESDIKKRVTMLYRRLKDG